jgi:hypothetical protein
MNFKKQDWVGRDLVSFYVRSCWSCNSLSWGVAGGIKAYMSLFFPHLSIVMLFLVF